MFRISPVIHDPTFVGIVVDKETRREHLMFTGPGFLVYRLHVIGEFVENGETVQVDRWFSVSRRMFNQFRIGDTIPHPDTDETYDTYVY